MVLKLFEPVLTDFSSPANTQKESCSSGFFIGICGNRMINGDRIKAIADRFLMSNSIIPVKKNLPSKTAGKNWSAQLVWSSGQVVRVFSAGDDELSGPKYPIPPGNSLTMLKFFTVWGDLTERLGMTTLKSCEGYQ